MITEKPAATKKAVFKPSQNPRSVHTLRLQMALDAAQQLARGERIKQLREESPYTQPKLAELVGVTLRAYQRWEAGGGIEWEHLAKLATIHEVDVQWIHKGKEQGAAPDPFEQLPYKTVDVERAIRMEMKLDALLNHFDVEYITPEAATKPKKRRPKK